MGQKSRNNRLFHSSIILLLVSLSAALSSPFQLQTLLPRPLPSAPTLSWHDSEPESNSLQETSQLDPLSSNTTLEVQLELHHVDALSSEDTPELLFDLRLQRDALRSGTIYSLVSKAVARNPPRAAGIPCRSPLCRSLDSSGCNQRRMCLYQVSYGDGSVTFGDFSTETLTFRRTSVGRVALGCGHDNEGLFVGAAGLLGLGRGILSFPSQTGSRFNRKFSYCLVDRSASSKPSSLVFGDAAIPRGALFTPLLTNPKLDTFYYVELLGISVGGTRVPKISPSLFKMDQDGNGGVIIDSGQTSVKVPTLVLHFRGADLSLPATNYLIPVDSSGTFCFAFAGTMNGLSIIGNIQQQGFRVAYDLAGSRVGFSPRGCA
ncbi:hypothetical protein V6Z11_D07G152200 [Gossypium hirsutum]